MRLDPKYKAVCFDMDGTLLDTKVDYEKMANICFDEMERLGVPKDQINRDEGYKFNIDSGLKWLYTHGHSEIAYQIGNNIKQRTRDVEMDTVNLSKPFPHAADLLIKLHSMGIKTGLLTRGCREYAITATKLCGVYDFLDGIVARDDYTEQEAKPSPIAMKHLAEIIGVKTHEILYFGDHKFDYQCARDAKSGFIAVLTGTSGYDDWKRINGVKICKSITDFYEQLESTPAREDSEGARDEI